MPIFFTSRLTPADPTVTTRWIESNEERDLNTLICPIGDAVAKNIEQEQREKEQKCFLANLV